MRSPFTKEFLRATNTCRSFLCAVLESLLHLLCKVKRSRSIFKTVSLDDANTGRAMFASV